MQTVMLLLSIVVAACTSVDLGAFAAHSSQTAAAAGRVITVEPDAVVRGRAATVVVRGLDLELLKTIDGAAGEWHLASES